MAFKQYALRHTPYASPKAYGVWPMAGTDEGGLS